MQSNAKRKVLYKTPFSLSLSLTLSLSLSLSLKIYHKCMLYVLFGIVKMRIFWNKIIKKKPPPKLKSKQQFLISYAVKAILPEEYHLQ